MKQSHTINECIKYGSLSIVTTLFISFLFNLLNKNGNDILFFGLVILFVIALAIGFLSAKHFYKTRETYIIKNDEKLMISLNVALVLISAFLIFNDNSLNDRVFKFIFPSLFYLLSNFSLYLISKIDLNIKHYKKQSNKMIRLN